MDRRRTTRYKLTAPVNFSWRNPGESEHRGQGFTRDISADGTFVLTDTCPPPGALIQIEVLFPAMEKNSVLKMRAQGKVSRVEAVDGDETNRGFAATCKSFVLRNKNRAER